MGEMRRAVRANRSSSPSVSPALSFLPASYPPALSFLSVLIAFVLLSACSTATLPDAKDYAAKLTADRVAKDAAFAASDDPVPRNRHAEVLPLAYYPIDPDYDVPAALKPAESSAPMKMPTSTGTQRDMRRVGTLEFTLKGDRKSVV